VIATFRLLASLWTLSDSHRVSSSGRRWARKHTPHLVMCTPGVRIGVERGVYLPACPSVARGYSYPVYECRCGCPGLQLLCGGRLHTALNVMLLVAAGRLPGRLVLPG
jgi:hypothetical protein